MFRCPAIPEQIKSSKETRTGSVKPWEFVDEDIYTLLVKQCFYIQNVPEGAIISMPMRAAGNSKWKSFFIGSLSGAVEPLGGLAVVLLASFMTPVLPYMLAFAAGAMFYVVVEELIPEANEGEHSNLSTIGFAIGFVLMMVLDVVMG